MSESSTLGQTCLTVACKLVPVLKTDLGGIHQSLCWIWLSQRLKNLLCFYVQLSQRLWLNQERGKLVTTHLMQTDTPVTPPLPPNLRVFPSPRLSSVFFFLPELWATVWINLLCILSKVIPFSGSVFALSLCNMEKNAKTQSLGLKVLSKKTVHILNPYLPSFLKHFEKENVQLLILDCEKR